MSLDSRERTKTAPYFEEEMDTAKAEKKKKGTLDFGSLPNLKANPLVGNVDGEKKRQKIWQQCSFKMINYF